MNHDHPQLVLILAAALPPVISSPRPSESACSFDSEPVKTLSPASGKETFQPRHSWGFNWNRLGQSYRDISKKIDFENRWELLINLTTVWGPIFPTFGIAIPPVAGDTSATGPAKGGRRRRWHNQLPGLHSRCQWLLPSAHVVYPGHRCQGEESLSWKFLKSTWGCSWDSIFVEWMTMVSSCKFTSISWDSRTSKYGKTCPLITGTATQKAWNIQLTGLFSLFWKWWLLNLGFSIPRSVWFTFGCRRESHGLGTPYFWITAPILSWRSRSLGTASWCETSSPELQHGAPKCTCQARRFRSGSSTMMWSTELGHFWEMAWPCMTPSFSDVIQRWGSSQRCGLYPKRSPRCGGDQRSVGVLVGWYPSHHILQRRHFPRGWRNSVGRFRDFSLFHLWPASLVAQLRSNIWCLQTTRRYLPETIKDIHIEFAAWSLSCMR